MPINVLQYTDLDAITNASDTALLTVEVEGDFYKITKANFMAIVNDLTTGGINVPLSAEQGKQLKTLLDEHRQFTYEAVTYNYGFSLNEDGEVVLTYTAI